MQRGDLSPDSVAGNVVAASKFIMVLFDMPTLSEGYLEGLGRFVLMMGRLETIACAVSQALGVTDPALLSTSIALRKARHQTGVSMPPWARIGPRPAREWIDDALSLVRERNQILHWAICELQWDPDEPAELGFISPHDMDWLATNTGIINDLARRTETLTKRGEELLNGLYCETEEWGLIDPLGSRDGVGSGDLGWVLGIIDEDWPEHQRKPGGKLRRER